MVSNVSGDYQVSLLVLEIVKARILKGYRN